MSECTIRPYLEEDIPAFLAIEQQVQYSPWSENLFRQPLEIARYQGRALCLGSEVIGYYLIEQVVDEATLHNIAIQPEYQGQGYGRLLLNDALQLCRSHGVVVIFLEVRLSNVGARHLYEQSGFRQVGLRKEYYATADGREAALVMRKALNV